MRFKLGGEVPLPRLPELAPGEFKLARFARSDSEFAYPSLHKGNLGSFITPLAFNLVDQKALLPH
ncbi:MAG: hypothetical protein NUV45_05240 [Tepidanaerobacteraceae bacterium]|jgi:hypothetical protein|nr:hypothetical protein [Tepidanaerobacteraceae bacterium]